MELSDKTGQYIFQMNKLDVCHICRTLLNLEFNSLSPLAGILNEHKTGAPPRTKDKAVLEELAGSPDAAKALSILTNPEVRLNISIGGGIMGLADISACRNRSMDAEMVVMTSPSFDDSIFVQSFDTAEAFVSWNINTIASKIDAGPPLMLPESIPFESFVYILHAIDSFRRVAYESMLEARILKEPYISMDRFASTMKLAIKNGDIRWLLPSFLRLIPDLSSMKFDPQMADLDFLVSNDILMTGRRSDNNESVYVFGEKGRCLSVDFYRTWWTSAGIELIGWDGTSALRRNRLFMASTAVANHFFEINPIKGGGFAVGYSPLTTDGLSSKLVQILNTAPPEQNIKTAAQAQSVRIEPQGQASVPSDITAAEVCARCGFVSGINDVFCSKCGTPIEKAAESPPPIPPRTKVCPNCNKALGLNAKFCSGCGKPV